MTAIQTILNNSETYQAKLTNEEINKDIYDQIGPCYGGVYTLNRTNVDKESNRIQSEIDYHNSMFHRTYLYNSGNIIKNEGEIKVLLYVKSEE